MESKFRSKHVQEVSRLPKEATADYAPEIQRLARFACAGWPKDVVKYNILYHITSILSFRKMYI